MVSKLSRNENKGWVNRYWEIGFFCKYPGMRDSSNHSTEFPDESTRKKYTASNSFSSSSYDFVSKATGESIRMTISPVDVSIMKR